MPAPLAVAAALEVERGWVRQLQAELDRLHAQVAAIPSQVPAPEPAGPDAGFWSRLLRGDLGLDKMYWFYGVLMAIPFAMSALER